MAETNFDAVAGALNSNFSPLEYITEGISYTNCTRANGGYIKIGKFVYVSIRITITTGSTGTYYYVSLPSNLAPVFDVPVNVINNSDDIGGLYAVVHNDAKIYIKGATSNKSFCISGWWIPGM